MSEDTHLAKAYSFSIAASDAFAVLRIGRKNFRVQVTDLSWAGFTVSAPQKLARRFKSGASGTLYHQGSDHPIAVAGTEKSDQGDVLVSLSRLDDKPQQRRAGYGTSKSIPRQLQNSDPVLSIASGLCILLLILAMPGWGDGWGTSHYFEDGLRIIGQSFYEIFRSFRGR